MEFSLGLVFLMIVIVVIYTGFFMLCLLKKWFYFNRHDRLADIALPGPWRHRSWSFWMLFGFRGATAVYAAYIFIGSLTGGFIQGLAFFTMWNYCMFTLYFLFVFIASAVFLVKTMMSDKNLAHSVAKSYIDEDEEPRLILRVAAKTLWIAFEICCTLVFLVDITVWAILLPNAEDTNSGSTVGDIVNFYSFNVHASNALFMMFEMFWNRLSFTPSHLLFVLLWALVYAMWSWVWFAWKGLWVYFFVDTEQNTAAGWYLLLLAMHSVFFFMVYGFWLLKEKYIHNKHKGDHNSTEAFYKEVS